MSLPRSSSQAAHAPQANLLDQVGDRKRVLRCWQVAHPGMSGHPLDYMQFGGDELQPLIFLTSIEYPEAPPWGFCVDAAAAGFGVFSIRRPGFGGSGSLLPVEDQALLIDDFLQAAGLENAILVSVGSANPVGVRLAVRSSRIGYSVFANSVFNRDILNEFRPAWFGRLIAQTLESRAGATVSLGAIRQAGRRFGSQWFYQTCFQKSPGDVEFVRAHPREMSDAWDVASAISMDTYRQELLPSLKGDPFLRDGLLRDLSCLVISGQETTQTWKDGLEAEAARLGAPVSYLSSGDIMVAYQSGNELLNLLRQLQAA